MATVFSSYCSLVLKRYRHACLLLLVIGLLAGCASLSSDRAGLPSASTFTNLSLPTERNVSHPDSARYASDERPSYTALIVEASAQMRRSSDTRIYEGQRHITFATLWNRDLAYAELEHEIGVGDLSEDTATDITERHLAQYDELVRIDIHTFITRQASDAMRRANFSGPGARIELRDAYGRTYRAHRVTTSTTESYTHASGDPGVYYRTNRAYFLRNTEHGDLLDTTSLRLSVRPASSSSQLEFRWQLPANQL